MLSYTRSMLAFLLFVPEPQRVVNVGLGGGSLGEVDPCAFARGRAGGAGDRPTRDRRGTAVFQPAARRRAAARASQSDGAAWVAAQPECADVILVDGYDGSEQVAELSSVEFYRDAARALRGNGVLVVNLWGNDRRFDDLFASASKAPSTVRCAAFRRRRRGNVIAMGFKRKPLATRWDELRERAPPAGSSLWAGIPAIRRGC